jgi:hypothetical protein
MYALLALVSHTQLIPTWVEKRLLACIRFSKLVQFQIHPPLNILTVPNWLNVKFHYFLIGQKVKILDTLLPMAPIYV